MAIGDFVKGFAGSVEAGAKKALGRGRKTGRSNSRPDWVNNPPEGFIVSSGGGRMGQERARMDASAQMLRQSGEKRATVRGLSVSKQWIDPVSGKFYQLYDTKKVSVTPIDDKSSTKKGLEDQVESAMERPSEPIAEGE